MDAFIKQLSPAQKRALAAIILAGGATGFLELRREIASSQREQQQLCTSLGVEQSTQRLKSPKVAVDAVFAARLKKILAICVPSPVCYEAGLIYAQGCLLVARTLLTEYVAFLEGRCGRSIIQQDFGRFGKYLSVFCGVGIPLSVVNSGLKYMQKRIKLAFQRRLTHHLHEYWCDHRAYYAASTLGGLTAADQRITEDVEKFAFAISELYSYTFKPLLDVVLFTRALAKSMGRWQLWLYGYYVVCAGILRRTSPPLALMTAQETALTGALRAAHQRLVTNAEEVAFNDPPAGMAEQMVLNQHLYRLLRHSRLSAFQHFVQQVLDSYFVKYLATVVALGVYALPLYLREGPAAKVGAGEVAQDYIQAMRLLQNTSRGIGDLVLVYKRITSLAGHTARVGELIEQARGVERLSGDNADEVRKQLYLRNVSSHHELAPEGLEPMPQPRRVEGDVVEFNRVFLSSPDGSRLVSELSFSVEPGRSVMIMGPNGSGKSSLFRVAAGLWPLQAGEITLPPKGELFYLSQRPYLVSGTLRDQLLYPEPPRAVWATAGQRSREKMEPWMRSLQMGEDELDERLCACLEAVELDYLLGRGKGWEQVQNWSETLSGGEKQRLAMARLLFHHPRYAILDECTSAVSADGEVRLYSECVKAGITMLSIGHRPALKRFHSVIVHFEGGVESGMARGWRLEQLQGADREGLGETMGTQPSGGWMLGPSNGSTEGQ
ncbi:hypothetical protein N2152v2_005995 [Parachlorella kessleri]